MNKTKIPWCDWTWNPIVGCSPASEGCAHCYAAAISKRFNLPWGRAWFVPERLDQPAKVRKPGRVFVCSMGDFYHESVDDAWRTIVLNVIGQCPEHTFIILTKRPERIPAGAPWFKNIWLGVTAENQARADERVRTLMARTCGIERPIVRFVSVEPMLGPVTFSGHTPKPDWVIAGPETGPKARPCDHYAFEALAAESPCFFDKRVGGTRREFPNAPAEACCQASPPAGCSTIHLCRQCAAECDRSAEWDAFHYGIQARCDGCDQHTLCAMMSNKMARK
jgi:protein gp37